MKAAMRLFFPLTLKGEAGHVTRTQKIFMRAFLATPRSVGRFHSRMFCLARKEADSKEADVGNSGEDGKDDDDEDENDDDEEEDEKDDDGEDGDDELDTETGVEETLAAVADVMVQLNSIMEKYTSHNPLWPCGSKAAKRLVRAVFPPKGTIG
jgi:hypothetical protein